MERFSKGIIALQKRASFALLFWLIALIVAAQQIPEGYYDQAEGLSNTALKTALSNKIKIGTRLGYGSGSGKTWSGFEKSDRHPDGYVWDMYSTNKRYFPGGGSAPGGMNIEHSVAKSWWGGSNNDAYKDLYHLNPSDSRANSARGSYPLGIVKGEGSFNEGSIKVGDNTFGNEYSGKCFEPLDEYKGDFARAYLYMFTCYEDFNWTGTSAPTMIVASQTWPMLKPWARDLLVQWSRQDPVSSKEINRAEAIYKLQENRNPYIDYPELVEYLWGNLVGQPFTTNSTTPLITSPLANSTIVLPAVHYTVSSTIDFKVSGKRLEGDLTLSLSSDVLAQFTLSTTKVTAEQAEAGQMVTLSFTPTQAGQVSALLTITGGGVATPISVTIEAAATDNFAALPATLLSFDRFTANWTPSSTATDYEISVSREVIEPSAGERTLLDAALTKVPEGWSTTGFTAIENGALRIASSGTDGALISAEYDLSALSTLTLKGKYYGSDAGTLLSVSVDGQQVERVAMASAEKPYTIEIPEATDESVIELSAQKGKRVVLSHIRLTTGGDKVTYPILEGYPKLTGLTTTYQVTGLEPGATYLYKVTTQGNTPTVSNEVSVTTLATSGVEDMAGSASMAVYGVDGTVYATSLPIGAYLRVFDMTGRLLAGKLIDREQMAVSVSGSSMAIVQVITTDAIYSYKVVLD